MRATDQIKQINSFEELASFSFEGEQNAACWSRNLIGDFSEIISKIKLADENIKVVLPSDLQQLTLSEAGNDAKEILLQDMRLLEKNGASPVLNVIRNYERDESFFPTDVYSFHVDRSPVPTDTYLCTYFGASSQILANSEGKQKIQIPAIRKELLQLFDGPEDEFESFLSEYFFDLHYEAIPDSTPVNLGIGNLWKLAVDHPESKTLPCLHRAPMENKGEKRLLLIC